MTDPSEMWSPDLDASRLSWAQVDPRRLTFDASAVEAFVRSLPIAQEIPIAPAASDDEDPIDSAESDEGELENDSTDIWSIDMAKCLISHYGIWVRGWWWGHDGWIGGGPVDSWCCAGDTMTSSEGTIRAVVAGVIEWRFWLEELAEAFESFLPIPASTSDEERIRHWELALTSLVTKVVIKTQFGDDWYRHCHQVLLWFLDEAGVASVDHAALIDDAIGGRFESWIEPDEPTVTAAAHQVATALVGRV